MLVHTSTRGCMRCDRSLEPGRLLYCAACRASIDAPQPEEISAPEVPGDSVRVHITKVIADDYYRRDVFKEAQRAGQYFASVRMANAMRLDAEARAGVAYRSHGKRLRAALRDFRASEVANAAMVLDFRQRDLFNDLQHVQAVPAVVPSRGRS